MTKLPISVDFAELEVWRKAREGFAPNLSVTITPFQPSIYLFIYFGFSL